MKRIRFLLLTLVALLTWSNPMLADTWTVAGVEALLGSNWNTEDTNNDMSAVTGTTLWKLTKQNVTLTAGDYDFKVVKDHEWTTAYPSDNRVLTVDADGTYDVTFWYNTNGNSVYATYVYSIIGDLWDYWATDKDMTQDPLNPNVYTLVVDNFEATAKTYEFKLHANHAWNDYQIPSGSGNETWECTQAGKYKLTFTANVVENTLTLNAEYAYKVDFNTAITTSDHNFQVASNWRHVVDTYTDYWDDISYVSYSYSATAGVDGSGALSCSTNQTSNSTYDLLITPVIKGSAKIDAKTTASYYTAQLEFYKITDNGDGTFTRGDKISVDVSAVNATDYTTITIPVAEAGERIGIRSSYVWLDNFSAADATIVPEPKITIMSAEPTATTGTIYWEQQSNGKVLVSYTVTVRNTGEVDLAQGDDGFSVSIINGSTGTVYGTVAVPQNLAKGETSDPFVVSTEVESSLWPNSYTYINMNLKDNLFGNVVERAQSHYTAYEPKFVFRLAGASTSSSISAAESWGTITDSTTKDFEIANTGIAPLTIKSITLPTGFTSANAPVIPSGGLVIAKGATQALSITQEATAYGTFEGTLSIVYLDKNSAEQTYELAFSATVINPNTWTADFNNTTSTVKYPAGSIAESGIDKDYQYISSGNYNNWLIGRNSNSYDTVNNKFITPKLHANANDKLMFDVKAGYSSSDDYFVKVYVSSDRKTWGDPVATYVYSNVGSSFTTKTITFDTMGDYYVAFAIYGTSSGIDNIVGLEKVDVAHDLYIKSVSWPDASIKSGTAQTKPSVDVIPLTDEDAANYTVKYIYGENEVEIASKALTASASSTTSFAASFTPVVANTTVFNGTKVVFDFGGGVTFETEPFDLTVTNEPIFHFLNTAPSSKWNEPTDRTAPIVFGKTNNADTQNFVLFNWGSADLTVKSISLPDGFTTTTEFPLVVTAFNGENSGIAASCQALDITFSAASAGDYSGNMVITYVDGNGNDQTFELAMSGTKLDPSKWYVNFDNQEWPAGSIYQSNVSISNINTNDYGLLSSSSTNNLFITPKLTALAGDKLQFDASTRNSSYDGTVKMYISSDRESWGEPVKELALSKTENTSKATYEYTFIAAGDYYVAFELNEARVDEIYGLTPVAVAHDWKIVSSNISATAMQNVTQTATVNILNLGLADEAADSYTVTAYVNDKAAGTGTAVAIPMNHKLSEEGTQLSVNFLSSKTGTFPVYLEVKAGDYSVTTDPVSVTFAEEQAVGNLTIGNVDAVSYDNSFVYNNDKNSESVSLYPASMLSEFGLNAGDRITRITYRGYKTTDSNKSSLKIWYQWTDDTNQSQPSAQAYNTDGMISIVDEAEHTWEKAGTSSSLVDMFSIDLSSSPIVCQANKGLRIVVRNEAESYKSFYIETTTISNAYRHNSDYASYTTNYWNSKKLAVLHLEKEVSIPTLTGTVKTSADAAIAGATVTLKAANGVEYTGTTDAEGAYSINVIQAGLDFTATVEADGYLKKQFDYSLGGVSKTLPVTLYTQMGIWSEELPGFDSVDKIMTQDPENPNIFTLKVEDVTVAAQTYKYKLRADGNWGTYELPASGDNNFNFSPKYGGYYTAGTYDLYFTANVSEHTLTLTPVLQLTLANSEAAANTYKAKADVTVARTLKAGWNAVVLPFAMTADDITTAFGANAEVAVFDGAAENAGGVSIDFAKATATTAGTPFLLYLEAAPASAPVFEGKDIDFTAHNGEGAANTFDFVGTFANTTAAAGDFIMAGGKFKNANGGNAINAYRAYLKNKGVSSSRVNFYMDGILIDEAEVTAITGVKMNAQQENVYNLSGQKINNELKKGVYIINGKKVVVK